MSRSRRVALAGACMLLTASCATVRGTAAGPTPGADVVPASASAANASAEPEVLEADYDPRALFDPDVICAGLYLAWEAGDRTAAARFAGPEAIDALFARRYVDYRGHQLSQGTQSSCEIHADTHVASGRVMGDGHVGWSVSSMEWITREEFEKNTD